MTGLHGLLNRAVENICRNNMVKTVIRGGGTHLEDKREKIREKEVV